MPNFEIVVVGAGMAGVSAAITAARLGCSVVLIDRLGAGGQVANAATIENLPGLPEGISGLDLGPRLFEAAEQAGVDLRLDTIRALQITPQDFIARGDEDIYAGGALIWAAGSELRKLDVPGEEKFAGRGLSHCASCDGPLYRGKAVCVIGGGDSALDEAVTLASFARQVTLVTRDDALSGQTSLRHRLALHANVRVLTGATPVEFVGASALEGVVLEERASGQRHVESCDGAFIYAGFVPRTELMLEFVTCDETGRIVTDLMMQSSRPGIYAVGDLRAQSVALLAACAGDGATAGVAAARHIRQKG
jgi:thioredoxin reductase (NADPH)